MQKPSKPTLKLSKKQKRSLSENKANGSEPKNIKIASIEKVVEKESTLKLSKKQKQSLSENKVNGSEPKNIKIASIEKVVEKEGTLKLSNKQKRSLSESKVNGSEPKNIKLASIKKVEKEGIPKSSKKRKRSLSENKVNGSEPKNIKLAAIEKVVEKESTQDSANETKPVKTTPNTDKKKNKKKRKPKKTQLHEPSGSENLNTEVTVLEPKDITLKPVKITKKSNMSQDDLISDELKEKYPILNNEELITRFRKIPINNNQKGRIRRAYKLQLDGLSKDVKPDIINGKIQAMLDRNPALHDSTLRKIRILYNMLLSSVNEVPENATKTELSVKKKNKIKKPKDGVESESVEKEEVQKLKDPKRYVVFIGNLPLDVDKEKLVEHFSEIKKQVKDVRIPEVKEGKKSAIAYIELNNEPSFEMALSKHHSMLGSKRINVLYTAQKGGKISKAEAKSKSAKLIALQKTGKLVGSTPSNKKRSHRRAILKQARAKEANAAA